MFRILQIKKTKKRKKKIGKRKEKSFSFSFFAFFENISAQNSETPWNMFYLNLNICFYLDFLKVGMERRKRENLEGEE